MATATKKAVVVEDDVEEFEETSRFVVTTTITIRWESDAETEAEAIEDGWNWGDHLGFSQVDDITVEEY